MKNPNLLITNKVVAETHKFYHPKYAWNVDLMISLLGKRKVRSILEIGCNYGANLMMMKDMLKIKDCVGADILNLKDLKKEYGYKFPFIKINLNKDNPAKLPQKDLILMIDILEHLDNPAKVLRQLRIKKYILIKIPVEKGIIKNILMALGLAAKIGSTHVSGHLHGYYLKEGLDLAKKGNLNIISWFYTFNPLYLNYPNINKGFTFPKKIFYNFDRLCRMLLPRRIYLSLFGGTLLMLCRRRSK